MSNFYYTMPIWLTTILILALSLAIGLGSSIGVRRLFRLKPSREEEEIAINLMQVVAAYIGIMLAFSAVVVWQNFAEAQTAVHQEAASAAEFYRDMTTYGPETAAARQDLRAYVGSVLKDEWPGLRTGESSTATETALANLFASFGKIRPQDGRDDAIYQEAFSKLNELVVLRRDRLIASRSTIPAIFWIVALIGSTLTVAYASAFSRSRYNTVMIAGTSMTLGLIFLFILTVNKPFKGQFSASNDDLVQLSDVFDRLDSTVSAQQAPLTASSPAVGHAGAAKSGE